MNLSFITVLLIICANVVCGGHIPKRSTETRHPGFRTTGNPKLPIAIDCALRAFGIEMAAYIAPTSLKANWTTVAQSAFQMNQCNGTLQTVYQSKKFSKPFEHAPEMTKGTCDHTVFVHDLKGSDIFDGTFDQPMKTVQAAFSRTRSLRTVHGNDPILCITIRGGTYYLGTNATTSSSQIGAIALTSNDSNLVIENYPGEQVILSGGTLLQLQWSAYAKVGNGTIMKAQVPSSVNLDDFNELYIDGKRAIVAKYPNGDPSTQGLYAANPGFSFDVQSWIPPVAVPGVKFYVSEPTRNGTLFTNFQDGLGGGASVFNPPRNYWSVTTPRDVDIYGVPRGFTVTNGGLPHISNWSKPTTGLVHAFHGYYWGNWMFEIAASHSAQNTIEFGRGGFQEAQAAPSGGGFYVANIFEELDSPNEWFLDKDTRTLYFMPNGTMPTIFVASQIPCLISVSGSSIDNPVRNVLIQGLTLTETSNTYMREYLVPSPGDWSVHRGGTIYLSNTNNITVTRSLFTQLGSNGIAVFDYNEATTITSSEFVWLADSGVILVGTTNGIDGFSVASQPTNILIKSNLFHETGIYVKQSAPVFIAVCRSISIVGNLMFNVPRAAVNINDGFYGNHTLSYNVMFNTVRETVDHGPINTWDRQPYLTDAVQSGVPSVWPRVIHIHHNTLFNDYHSIWPLSHDDGSSFYEDSYNFLVYGGKKNYLGYSKANHHEIYVYPDLHGGEYNSNNCMDDFSPEPGTSGWNETWVDNICILYQSVIPYQIDSCDTANLFVPYLANNTIYIPAGKEVTFTCNVNGVSKLLSLQEWQSYGLDLGTVVGTAPDVQVIIEWGRKMLQNTM